MKHEPMSQERLEAIASRAATAERGPWEVTNGGDNDTSTFIDGPDGDVLIRNMRGHGYLSEEYVWVEEPNAQFIAHAREDVPALLAEVERLRARLTVDDDMVERAARAPYGPVAWGRLLEAGDDPTSIAATQISVHRAMTRAVLDAALSQ